MCIGITDKLAQRSAFFGAGKNDCVFTSRSFGTNNLIGRITEFRNFGPPRPLEGVRGAASHGCLEVFGRRAVAEFAYLGLVVVAAVEAIARVAFALLTLIPAIAYSCCCENAKGHPLYETIIDIGGQGLIGGPDAILRCFVAAAKNPFVERMAFEDLALCHCIDG